MGYTRDFSIAFDSIFVKFPLYVTVSTMVATGASLQCAVLNLNLIILCGTCVSEIRRKRLNVMETDWFIRPKEPKQTAKSHCETGSKQVT